MVCLVPQCNRCCIAMFDALFCYLSHSSRSPYIYIHAPYVQYNTPSLNSSRHTLVVLLWISEHAYSRLGIRTVTV